MKKWWPIVIVSIGTIGLLVYFINDAFYSELTNPLGAVRMFKYFTILSNLIAVVYFWLLYSLRLQLKYVWFDHLLGGIVVYLLITFAMYLLFLQGTIPQTTLQTIGNICLHYLNPFLVTGYLAVYYKDYKFSNKDIFLWIVFPIVYLMFLVVHGIITSDYLYPFFNVAEVHVSGLISMIAILIGVFLILSFAIVKIVSRK